MALNALIYLIAWMLALNVWDSFKDRGELFHMLKGIRLKDVLFGLSNLSLLISALLFMLYLATQFPILEWSWLKLLGTEGSALTAGAQAEHTVPTSFIVAMYVLLILAMPFIVLTEEKMFRAGSENRSRTFRIAASVLFGLSHMVIGFPVFAALALAPMGAFLTGIYLREWRKSQSRTSATLASARAHLMSNVFGGVLMSLLYFGLAES